MALYVYPAVIEGGPGGYAAYFPDLPGCVTAADTQAELLASAREALTLHIQGMLEDGDALPAATRIEALEPDPEAPSIGHILVDAEADEAPVRVNVSFPPSALRRIDAAAEQRGLTRSGFLVAASRAYMDAGSSQQLTLTFESDIDPPLPKDPSSGAAARRYYAGSFTRCAAVVAGEVFDSDHVFVAHTPQNHDVTVERLQGLVMTHIGGRTYTANAARLSETGQYVPQPKASSRSRSKDKS